jgi:hypothetical protein
MMSKDKKGISLGRRDFIKTAAMAVVGSTLSFASLHAKDLEILSKPESVGRYRRKNKNLLCLSEYPSGYNKLIKLIESKPDIDFQINPIQVNFKNTQGFMESIQGKDAAILLLCLPSRTFSFGRLAQSLGDLDIPMLLYSPNSDLIMIDANFAAELRAKGASVKLAGSETEVIEMLKTASAPGLLEGKKALVYGRPFESISVPAHNLTEDYVYEHTGVRIEYRPMDELITLLKDVSKDSAAEEMERWKKEADKVDRVPAKVLLDECRMYILLSSIIAKEKLSAISIDCLSFSFTPNPIMPLPCLAFARLRDEGITAACEADVCGMLTSMVFEQISGRSSFFANVASVNTQRSSAVLRHCVSPLKLMGPGSPHLPYRLYNYHGLGTALVPKVEYPTGIEVTMGSYTKDLKSFVLWPGKTCAGEDDTDQPFGPNFHVHKYCSNRVEVVIKDFDRFYQNIANLHHIMVVGNYTKKIADAMSAENVNLIGPLDSIAS